MIHLVRQAVLAVLLAVLLQLPVPHAAAAMAHICGTPAAPQHQGMDCDHCPLCTSVASHAALLPAPPAAPAARMCTIGRAAPQPAIRLRAAALHLGFAARAPPA